MKVTLSWLNEFAPFGDDATMVAAHLTQLGIAVEEIIPVNQPIDGVIVAKVTRRAKHPNADSVGLVWVDIGNGNDLQICCGAFNMTPGDLVPLATVGTTMPDGRNIQAKPLRGEASNGMLCSQRELGLGDDHAGIWILPPDLALGESPWTALGMTLDYVFDLDLTRNRPETWGVIGIARDLAARMNVAFNPPGRPVAASGDHRSAPVDIVSRERCGRFTSTVITGVQVKSSTAWMAQRLTAAGMRPINNVVDVSNYVMLELNQPNHAYDLAALGGGGFRIRCADDGEQLVTLDGSVRSLTADDLLICDANDRPIGLGGVMGGENTEISDATTTVALEIAWFEPSGIQRTAVRHGLRTEAGIRFERGVDHQSIEHGIERFVELLRETCPDAVLAPGMADARGILPEPPALYVRTDRVNAVLGTSLSDEDIVALLAPIGFSKVADVFAVPTWRPDCVSEIEIIEEVARQYGYDRIGKIVPTSPLRGQLTPRQEARRVVRSVLLGLGCSEAMPNPWLGDGDAARAGLSSFGEPIGITNPMAAEESVLRPSLLPGLLKVVAYNESHRNAGVRFFEIGHVVRRPAELALLPDEHERLAVVLAGCEAPAAVSIWNEIVATLGIKGSRLQQAPHPGLHPGRSAGVFAAGRPVGCVGEVHPDCAEAFGVSERLAWLDVDLDALLASPQGAAPYKRVSRYPSSDVDLAFIVPVKVTAEQVAGALRKAAGDLLADVGLFDVYRANGATGDSRSLAYRLRLQAGDRTLNDSELAGVRDSCIAGAAKLGATLR